MGHPDAVYFSPELRQQVWAAAFALAFSKHGDACMAQREADAVAKEFNDRKWSMSP